MFGPVQNEDGSWRFRMNYELNELIEKADIVRFIKSRRAWLGHVIRMDDRRTPKKILEWKPIHSLVFSLEGQAWQEPEPSHVTGMALAHCILGKFLGVVCL